MNIETLHEMGFRVQRDQFVGHPNNYDGYADDTDGEFPEECYFFCRAVWRKHGLTGLMLLDYLTLDAADDYSFFRAAPRGSRYCGDMKSLWSPFELDVRDALNRMGRQLLGVGCQEDTDA